MEDQHAEYRADDRLEIDEDAGLRRRHLGESPIPQVGGDCGGEQSHCGHRHPGQGREPNRDWSFCSENPKREHRRSRGHDVGAGGD